jgi:hypothetical protein
MSTVVSRRVSNFREMARYSNGYLPEVAINSKYYIGVLPRTDVLYVMSKNECSGSGTISAHLLGILMEFRKK